MSAVHSKPRLADSPPPEPPRGVMLTEQEFLDRGQLVAIQDALEMVNLAGSYPAAKTDVTRHLKLARAALEIAAVEIQTAPTPPIRITRQVTL